MTDARTEPAAPEVRAAAPARPLWLRWRFWIPLAVLVVAGALASTVITQESSAPLDPRSAAHAGSKALAAVLHDSGITVARTSRLSDVGTATADESLLVTDPDAYPDDQLRRLRTLLDDGAGRLVLVEPSPHALAVLGVDATPESVVGPADGPVAPDCPDRGASAAGPVTFPDDTAVYRGTGGAGSSSCYGGVVITGPVTIIGSPALLRNDEVGRDGIAALDVNAITGSRQQGRVVWLLPGSEATAQSAPTFWQLFPSGVRRAALWLLGVGVLLVLWRGRRLGPVVREPLPVVVRAAEVVEGHGRLYRRAGARDHAAAALRSATLARLRQRLGLARGSGVEQIAAAVAPVAGRDPQAVLMTLAGPVPADDRDLLRLVHDLDTLEAAAGVGTSARPASPPDPYPSPERGAHG